MTSPGIAGPLPERAAHDGHEAGEAASDEAASGQDAEPAFPSADTGWLRLSSRSMVVRPLTDLTRLLPLLAGLLILHSSTGSDLVWGVLAAVAAVVTGLVHWATTRYRITSERVYVRRGLLNKRSLSVARDRIRTVDVTAHLLHRVLGVCRVSIGTGRNDYRSGESIHLDGLTRVDAESLRIVLLTSASLALPFARGESGRSQDDSRASRTGADTAGIDSAGIDSAGIDSAGIDWAGTEGRQIVRLKLSWLRFAPLTMTGLVVLGVLFGSVIQFSNAANVNPVASGPVRLAVRDFAALGIAGRVLAGGVVAMAGYVLVALVGYVAVYWNFRLAEYGTGIVRVTRGLLSVRATTITLSRLRGVEISEPLLLRAARGARCIAITTGLQVGRGAEHEGSVLLPPAPREVARQVAAHLLGIPVELCAGPLTRHGPAALRRRVFRALAGAVLIIAAIWAATRIQHGPAWAWIGSLVLLPIAVAVAADRYRSLGHRLSGGWLVTRTGTFARRRNIIGTDAIIGWRIHQTYFQRRQGLMTLTATTAAGQQHYSLRDVPVDQGLAVALAATGDLLNPFLNPG